MIHGRQNIIDPTARIVEIYGDYNVVGKDCYNIQMFGSSGCTAAGGVSNVMIVASSGITVDESNTVWIRNGRQSAETAMRSVRKYLSSGDILSINSTPIEIIAAPGDGQIIDVISTVWRYNYGTATYAGGNNFGVYNGTVSFPVALAPTDLLLGAVSRIGQGVPQSEFRNANTALNARAASAFTTGNGYVILEVLYRVIEI